MLHCSCGFANLQAHITCNSGVSTVAAVVAFAFPNVAVATIVVSVGTALSIMLFFV